MSYSKLTTEDIIFIIHTINNLEKALRTGKDILTESETFYLKNLIIRLKLEGTK